MKPPWILWYTDTVWPHLATLSWDFEDFGVIFFPSLFLSVFIYLMVLIFVFFFRILGFNFLTFWGNVIAFCGFLWLRAILLMFTGLLPRHWTSKNKYLKLFGHFWFMGDSNILTIFDLFRLFPHKLVWCCLLSDFGSSGGWGKFELKIKISKFQRGDELLMKGIGIAYFRKYFLKIAFSPFVIIRKRK